MYLAYFDESGDSGQVYASPTRFFVLGCVLIHEAQWLRSLNRLVSIRRRLNRRFGIKFRPELKASHIKKGRGALDGLGWSRAARMKLFRTLLRLEPRLFDELHTFAVAIDKRRIGTNVIAHELAWRYALERVQTFCRKKEAYATLFPDRGLTHYITKAVRKMRRYHHVGGMFGGVLAIPADRIIEDPNERDSRQSFFVQMADLNAYAAHRSRYIDPLNDGTESLWDELAGSRLLAVNSLRGGPPGIVIRP